MPFLGHRYDNKNHLLLGFTSDSYSQ